jgi:hypothetical protein
LPNSTARWEALLRQPHRGCQGGMKFGVYALENKHMNQRQTQGHCYYKALRA